MGFPCPQGSRVGTKSVMDIRSPQWCGRNSTNYMHRNLCELFSESLDSSFSGGARSKVATGGTEVIMKIGGGGPSAFFASCH